MRIGLTVEFTHEVAGKRESATVRMSQKMGDKKAYGLGTLENHIYAILDRAGIVKPQVTKFTYDAEPMLDFEGEF